MSHVYILPALLGGFVGAFVVTSMPKAATKAGVATLQQSPAAPIEFQ